MKNLRDTVRYAAWECVNVSIKDYIHYSIENSVDNFVWVSMWKRLEHSAWNLVMNSIDRRSRELANEND